ncbi:GD14268 [Drosophila simulans]|uniref:GD14268 n=1 Tax=Drosophila simulans TaxID=7240 RepID=B4QPL5_DROSI|nr:GD14268 [Drosophila simulans]
MTAQDAGQSWQNEDEDGHEDGDGDGSGDRNRGQQVQLGSSRLWEYAARSHFSLAASLCNSNISSSNSDIDDISDRRMSLSSSVCCPLFFASFWNDTF